jgi:sortase A
MVGHRTRDEILVRTVSIQAYSILVWIARLFLTIGGVALGVFSLIYLQTQLYQDYLRSRFLMNSHITDMTRVVTADPINITASLPVGKPRWAVTFGKIDIPSVGLSAIVLEGDDENILRLAVGHIPGTAVPGHSGNVGIAGHRDTFFRPLRKISVGDEILFSTTAGTFTYRVVSLRIVPPDAIEVLDDTERPTLTLVTCYPFYYIGAAPKRFIVRAEMAPAPLK